MAEELSLRERKKIQTRRALWRAAAKLFLERGYDQVSVAEVALAAEVSKMTVFNYMSSKEDLVLGPMKEHIGDAARAVRDRSPGESAVAAFRRDFMAALNAYDASVGMSDDPYVLQVRRMIQETPALLVRAHEYVRRAQMLLAEELAASTEGPEAELAPVVAAQLMSVRYVVHEHNHRRLFAGESAEEILPGAVVLAERAFALVEHGLGDFGTLPAGTGADTAQAAEAGAE
ncbi:TetR family transcriptional regulator [Streptomyces roseoverticillatus]|uniref:TetR/AcrR family transcriptional regulator n=1 Tax=Streptomyces roseoverticillatus TaxID=66429 RepID=UPI001F48FA65|nr:TetR/AcrR family transcriptional regulator [Streptomyces roseoverticillatus]MCF3099993.1 TetR family transcriptional regulator [Streptomyces roseoverticillatus]